MGKIIFQAYEFMTVGSLEASINKLGLFLIQGTDMSMSIVIRSPASLGRFQLTLSRGS